VSSWLREDSGMPALAARPVFGPPGVVALVTAAHVTASQAGWRGLAFPGHSASGGLPKEAAISEGAVRASPQGSRVAPEPPLTRKAPEPLAAGEGAKPSVREKPSPARRASAATPGPPRARRPEARPRAEPRAASVPAGREHLATALPESDPRKPLPLAPAAQDHRVAVLQEGAVLAVGQRDRVLAAGRQ